MTAWPSSTLQGPRAGFTLLELLVSITLMGVIVLVVSLGLRMGLRAWARGKEANKALVSRMAVEGLLARQLRAVVGAADPRLSGRAYFRGREHELAFSTTYVPLGAGSGGVFKVVYRYEQDRQVLVYAHRLVLTRKDLDERLPDSAADAREEGEKSGWMVTVVEDLPEIRFGYQGVRRGEGPEPEWKDEWPRGRNVPGHVALFWGKDHRGAVFSTDPLGF